MIWTLPGSRLRRAFLLAPSVKFSIKLYLFGETLDFCQKTIYLYVIIKNKAR